jgi:hypothetical protein
MLRKPNRLLAASRIKAWGTNRLIGVLALLFFTNALMQQAAQARTWQITADGSGDAPTIQAGIDSAAAGDTVLVAAGTYVENVSFTGEAIVVRSEFGPAATTIEAASNELPVVLFESGESSATTLEGFTIEGGRNGVRIIDAEPTIQGNVIWRNSGDVGGLLCGANSGRWSPRIMDNEVYGNHAGTGGGAIAIINHVVPVITGNWIHDNVAEDDGGGIWVRSDDGGAIISRNIIVGNLAGDHGGGIYVSSPASYGQPLYLEVSFNIVARNDAERQSLLDFSGGGCWLSNTNAWIHHNTIVENTGIGYGNAVAILRTGSPLIEKNVLAQNHNGDGVWCSETSVPIARDNLVWAASWGNDGGTCANWFASDGNLVADPRFCSPGTDDYSLSDNSPAMSHTSGPLGAVPEPGCSLSPTELHTWGWIKSRFTK